MALSSSTVFEVQSGGSDNNGGGFISGASGTDYSQSGTPHVAIDNSTITATATNASPSVMTLAGYTVSNNDVGNLVTLTGGTNIVAGTYSIASVNTSTNKWTLDQNCCSGGAGSAITGNMGGAFATPAKALGLMTKAGMLTYIKAATYQITSNLATPTISAGGPLTRIVGYSSTRGDNGRATIQAASTNFDMMSVQGLTNQGWTLENIVIDGNSQTGINGLSFHAAMVINCIIKNCTKAWAVNPTGTLGNTLYNSEVGPNALTETTINSTGAVFCDSGAVCIDRCYIHDNSTSATSIEVGAVMAVGSRVIVLNSIVYNNTGTMMYGIFGAFGVQNCAIHANSNGIYAAISYISNNIITSNGGYGITALYASTNVFVCYNAYYNNTSGEKHNITAGNGEVTLTGLPYVNAPTDFALNNTSGEGLDCKGAGTPGTIGLSSTVGTGYLDIGPLQRIGPAPGGGVTTASTFVS